MHRHSTYMLLLAVSILFSALHVPLEVNNWTNVTRRDEPVTQGVCLPAGLITNLSDLKITNDAGVVVPAQFKVLTRWLKEKHTGVSSTPSVKWVLCDFQVPLVGATSSSRFFLKDGGGNVNPSTGLVLNEDVDGVIVTTGPLKFKVSKTHFNLFDELWFDANSNNTFEPLEKLIVSSTENGGFITAGNWTEQECVEGTVHSTSSKAPTRIVIEESGTMKVVLRVEGRHYATVSGVSKGLYDYQVFITAYAGSPFVDVQWGVTNLYMEGTKPAQVSSIDPYKIYAWPFTNYRLVMNLNLGASQNYSVLGATEVTGGATASPIRLLQKNGSFSLTGTAGGTDALGAVSLSDGTVSVMAAMRNFAPNVPKGISVKQGQLVFELFPDTGAGSQYWLDPLSRKNHRIRIQFAQGTPSAGTLTALSKVVDAPLRMLAPREWYQSCRAWYRGLGIPNAAKWNRMAPSSWTRQNITSSTLIKLRVQVANAKLHL